MITGNNYLYAIYNKYYSLYLQYVFQYSMLIWLLITERIEMSFFPLNSGFQLQNSGILQNSHREYLFIAATVPFTNHNHFEFLILNVSYHMPCPTLPYLHIIVRCLSSHEMMLLWSLGNSLCATEIYIKTSYYKLDNVYKQFADKHFKLKNTYIIILFVGWKTVHCTKARVRAFQRLMLKCFMERESAAWLHGGELKTVLRLFTWQRGTGCKPDA